MNSRIKQVEDELSKARRRLELGPEDDFASLHEPVLRLEGELAKLTQQPYVEELDVGLICEPNVSTPFIVGQDNKLAIGFLICPWNPGSLVLQSGLADKESLYGLILMPHVCAWKVDSLGDDTHDQHPSLSYPGYNWSMARSVFNSPWIEQLSSRRGNHTHRFKPKTDTHMIFQFHDDVVEIISRGWISEVYETQQQMFTRAFSWISNDDAPT